MVSRWVRYVTQMNKPATYPAGALGKRTRLACVRIQGMLTTFVRRGNSTERLEPHEIEEIVRERLGAED